MSAFALSLAASAAALRVASVDLCADEYLMLMARPNEVASVSRVGRDPLDSAVAEQARRFPANDGTIESLLPLRPRLIVRSGSGASRSTALVAGRLGIHTLSLPYPVTIDDVAANLTRVAGALGDRRRAGPWIERLRAIRRTRPAMRDAAFLSGAGQSLGPESLGSQWMALAGLEQRALPGGRLTLEMLAVAPPAVLLVSDYRAGQASLGQRWLKHPLVANARSRRIATDGRRWTCAGPLMLDEVERLRGAR